MQERYFLAYTFPQEVELALSDLRWSLQGARWTAEENFHLTIKFIGPLETAQVRDLMAEMHHWPIPPLWLNFNKLGYFKQGRYLRVLWAGTGDPEILEPLDHHYRKVSNLLNQLKIRIESRQFSPHVTLARFFERVQLEDLIPFLSHCAEFKLPAFPLGPLNLMSSTLTPSGPHYRVIHSVAPSQTPEK